MLIFNDGPPRAGKSYDAVKNHILPALKAGRVVFARLDGLDHDAIAAYLKLRPERVRELLHHVEPDDVVPTFRCRREGSNYIIPDRLRDALVLIDEVHEFYPAGMKPLEREQEQFFARHGQFGLDIVVASQTFDRLHSEIRARVERRVLFRKLSHFAGLRFLGIGGKDQYAQRFQVTMGNGKFQVVGNERQNYDPAIFPLYAGYQPGTTNTEVYEGGTKEAAGMGLRFYAPAAALAALVGLVIVVRFFDKDDSPLVARAQASEKRAEVAQTRPPSVAPPVSMPANMGEAVPQKARPPGIAYVEGLAKQHRIRAAGKYTIGGGEKSGGWVEFRSSQRQVVERLDVSQLEALGWIVGDAPYGYELKFDDLTLIATAWPADEWGRVSEAEQGRLRERGGAGPAVWPATADPSRDSGHHVGTNGDGAGVTAYGAFRP